jgi:hypothetical protein
MNPVTKQKLSKSQKAKWDSGTRRKSPPGTGKKISKALRRLVVEGKPLGVAKLPPETRKKMATHASGAVPQGSEHPHSKWWKVRDPMGRVYTFKNLKHFVLTHGELFDPEDCIVRTLPSGGKYTRASSGMCKLKNPRRERAPTSWKGWTMVALCEEDEDILNRQQVQNPASSIHPPLPMTTTLVPLQRLR